MSSSKVIAPSSELRAPSSSGSSLAAPSSLGSSLILPGDRPADVVAFEARMAAFFVDAAEILGVPKSVAVIYGVIFASAEPLSFSDIEARVNFSKGSVSQGLRVLREVGAIKEAPSLPRHSSNGAEAGSQLATHGSKPRGSQGFVPDLELRKLISRFLELRLEKQLSSGSSRLKDLAQSVPTGSQQAAKELKLRLKSLSDWHTRARQLLPIARTFLKITPG